MAQISSYIRNALPFTVRRSLKRIRRRIINTFRKCDRSISIDAFRSLIAHDLGISLGDSIIVSSSFASLNAAFSPNQLIDTLLNIVGPTGNIVMPFYPPGNSEEWVRSGQVFDMQSTPSSMGILTQKFSERPDVVKSMHPFKAVVAWGKDADKIVSRHHLSRTPFDESSPYGWLLRNPSKSLGLGVKNNPMFHACEDFLSDLHCNLYLDEELTALVRNGEEVFPVTTLVHSSQVMDRMMAIGDYIPLLNLKSYKRTEVGYSFCYVLDNQELLERCRVEFATGRFRYKE